MLNINQNFDLKAPVFNFDRDYFNSVEELNAYDTSNIPNHFVTNVAGMLYLFTNGKWWPILGTTHNGSLIFVGGKNSYLDIGDLDRSAQFGPGYIDIYGSDQAQNGRLFIDTDTGEPNIELYDDRHGMFKFNTTGFRISSGYVSDPREISLNINDTVANEEYGSSVNMCLTNGDYKATINVYDGFRHKTDDGFVTSLNGYGLYIERSTAYNLYADNSCIIVNNEKNETLTYIGSNTDNNYLLIGSDEKFKISRPVDNSEGATITGVKSLTAFSNRSATKVWATDGSTVNMPTKLSDLTNDGVYITGNKGETNARFKITYNDNGVLRSQLLYGLRKTSTCIPELGFMSYDTSGNHLSQIRIRPEDNRDDGQYVIQVQDIRGSKVNCVSSIVPNSFQVLNNETNTAAEFASNELIFYTHNNDFQVQLKINKEGITKTNGKATEVFAANGSIIDLINYFNGTTTIDKLKSKAVEVTDDTNSVTVSPTGITATNGSATKVFATDGSTVDLTTKADASALATKANASDVLLKKSASGGYYIEENGNLLGLGAFAANKHCTASVAYSFAEGVSTKAIAACSHAEGYGTKALGNSAHAEGQNTNALGNYSHAEGQNTNALGDYSHAEGQNTTASGYCSHALGTYNIDNKNAIHSVGIGNSTTRKNAEYIYAKNNESGTGLTDDPKNGYKYLIGVGGYDGISTDNTTYKSVQEVIVDLTARIEQLETLVANCVSISNTDEQTN